MMVAITAATRFGFAKEEAFDLKATQAWANSLKLSDYAFDAKPSSLGSVATANPFTLSPDLGKVATAGPAFRINPLSVGLQQTTVAIPNVVLPKRTAVFTTTSLPTLTLPSVTSPAAGSDLLSQIGARGTRLRGGSVPSSTGAEAVLPIQDGIKTGKLAVESVGSARAEAGVPDDRSFVAPEPPVLMAQPGSFTPFATTRLSDRPGLTPAVLGFLLNVEREGGPDNDRLIASFLREEILSGDGSNIVVATDRTGGVPLGVASFTKSSSTLTADFILAYRKNEGIGLALLKKLYSLAPVRSNGSKVMRLTPLEDRASWYLRRGGESLGRDRDGGLIIQFTQPPR